MCVSPAGWSLDRQTCSSSFPGLDVLSLSLPPPHLAAGSKMMLSNPLLPACANYEHDQHVQQHRCHGVNLSAFNLIWEELADPEPEPPACLMVLIM